MSGRKRVGVSVKGIAGAADSKGSVAGRVRSGAGVADNGGKLVFGSRRRLVGSRHFVRFVLLLLLAASAAALWSRGAAVEWLVFGALSAVSVWCLLIPYIMVGRIEAERLIETPKVLADGDELQIRLVISITRPLPLAWLAISEGIVNITADARADLSYKRVLLPWLTQKQTVTYRVKGLQRGELSFLPLRVMVGDLLGMTVRTFEIECPGNTLVMSRPPEASMSKWLPSAKSAGDRRVVIYGAPMGSGAAAAGRAGAGIDMRVYAPGDPLRRVNWRAMARGLGMQTRLSEWDSPCDTIILLDACSETFRGDQRMFDACVGRAALALRNLFESGKDVKLLASGKEELQLHAVAGNRASLRHAEEQLARLRADGPLPLYAWLQDRMSRLPKGITIICITAGSSFRIGEEREAVEHAARLAAVRGGRACFWLAGEEASQSAASGGALSGMHGFNNSIAYMPIHSEYRKLPVIEGRGSDAAASIGP